MVSVQNRIEKRYAFWLDLFELHDKGLIDFEQFNNIPVTQEWIQNAEKVRKQCKLDKNHVNHMDGEYFGPYWICGFCRRYVQESRVSIKRLGQELKITPVEMAIIHKIEPVICPHCYRKRMHIKRKQFVWEIIALWIFYLIVWWILLIFVLLGMLLWHSSELREQCRKCKRDIAEKMEKEETGFIHTAMNAGEDDCDFCQFHYKDRQLIAAMKNDHGDEHQLFDPEEANDCWGYLHSAKHNVDPLILLERIEEHILNLSKETQFTKFKFFDEFIKMDQLKGLRGSETIWEQYFMPLSEAIFNQIQGTSTDKVPLNLFAKFPFEVCPFIFVICSSWKKQKLIMI